MELLRRLHAEADAVLAGAEPSLEDAETNSRLQVGCNARERVLGELDPSGGKSA